MGEILKGHFFFLSVSVFFIYFFSTCSSVLIRIINTIFATGFMLACHSMWCSCASQQYVV